MPVSFAELKPSVLNFLLFCFYLILASTFLKFVFVAKLNVPGLTPLVAAI